MKKNIIYAAISLILISTFGVIAQEKVAEEKKEKAEMPKAEKVFKVNLEDVRSIDAIIAATYDVISGDAGVKRDWDRFHSLFYKDARMIPSGKSRRTGVIGARSFTAEGYMKRNRAFLETQGFHEQEVFRRTEIFGNIAHVFSTYAARKELTDETPFMRGINSFQLLNDGERWWIITIFWQAETPESPLPDKYLPEKEYGASD